MGSRTKYVVLACASLIPFGPWYMKHGLGPIKLYFIGSGFSNTQFGGFLGAASWPNMILPLVSGFVVDERGARFSALLFTFLALFGHCMFSVFLYPPVRSYFFAIVARVLYGIGEGGCSLVQGVIIGKWIKSNLSFAVGFTESVHFLANWLGAALPAAVVIDSVNKAHIPFESLLLGGIFLLVSLLSAFVYYIIFTDQEPFTFALVKNHSCSYDTGGLLGRRPSDSSSSSDPNSPDYESRPHSLSAVSWYGTVKVHDHKDLNVSSVVKERTLASAFSVQLARLKQFPIAFWLIGLLHFLFSNIHNLFGGFAADYIHQSTNLSPSASGFLASVDSISPILLAPTVGFIVDKKGGRMSFCFIAALSSATAFLMFLNRFGTPMSPMYASCAMLLLSISNSLTPTLVKSAVPALIIENDLGTAFGVYSMFESFGGGVGHVVFGYVRDHSSDYQEDIFMLLTLCVVAAVLCLVTLYMAPDLNKHLNR